MTANSVSTKTRLIEIDFFRGLALLIIFWNHLVRYSGIGLPFEYGFSDAANVFIFLSGYVSGLVYWKTYNAKGFKGTFFKALKRSSQIYTAHILALASMLFLASIVPTLNHADILHSFLHKFNQNRSEVIFQILTLRYFPPLFDILPLYILLVFTIPFVIYLIKIDWKIVFIISLVLYCATQIFPQLDFQTYYSSWSLNPPSWLFLFTTAMIMGIKNREGSLHVPIKKLYVILAAVVLLYSFSDLKTIDRLFEFEGLKTGLSHLLFPYPFPLTNKKMMQPSIVIHFFILLYFILVLIPHLMNIIKSRFANPIVICGQHSLALFSTDIVLNYLFLYLILAFKGARFYFYFFAILGLIITILLGYILSNKKRRIKIGTPQPAAPAAMN